MSGPREARGRAHARVALVGNPSDGYGGRTIGLLLRNFVAEVRVRQPSYSGNGREDGAKRLAEAAIARFGVHCEATRRPRPPLLDTSIETDIPREVGLGGSSAIVIATLRALCAHSDVEIEPGRMAEIALAAETEELGIAAGLQDRVVQSHEGLVFMNFDPAAEDPYEPLALDLLPPLFVAYRSDARRPSGDVHSDLRHRFDRGDPTVVEPMAEIAQLAERGRAALLAGDHDELGRLMRANVDLRAKIVDLDPLHLRMVELADSLGAAANYAGSGGAIVGLVPGAGIESVRAAFARERCTVIEPALT